MKYTLSILWAFAATLFNERVLSTANAPTPLAFRRGTDEMKLVHCDYERPGWATFETPSGERKTELLADGELGQLVVAYGNATGTRIELPPLVAQAGEETEARAATAAGGYGDRVHP